MVPAMVSQIDEINNKVGHEIIITLIVFSVFFAMLGSVLKSFSEGLGTQDLVTHFRHLTKFRKWRDLP